MSWYVGIDPSSRHLGLAALHENGQLRYQGISATGDVPDRFVFIRASIRQWLAQYADDGVWCIVIEDPATRHQSSTLAASLGVCVEAARSILPDAALHILKSAHIKRLALGSGAGKKPDMMAHARTLGYTDGLQDVADAVVCADAARVLTSRNMREAA